MILMIRYRLAMFFLWCHDLVCEVPDEGFPFCIHGMIPRKKKVKS